MKILVLMVVYNKKITETVTYNNLIKIKKKLPQLYVVVVDNSTLEYHNENTAFPGDVKYIKMNGNAGLSKAYNTVLNYEINDFNQNDLLVFLDDDTDVNINYFKELIKDCDLNKETDIFAPIIKGQNNVIYSPNSSNFFKNNLISNLSDINKIKKYNAISSCMAVRFKVFKNYRFDERLFLDEIDQKFFDDQRRLKRKFSTLNIIINQNFHQRNSNLKSGPLWRRFKIRIRDIIIYGKIKGKRYCLLAYLKTNMLGIQFAAKTGDISIIKKTFGLSNYWLRKGIE